MSAITREDDRFIVDSVPELKKLQGKSILITGASGFIGANLISSLAFLNDNYSTHVKIFALSRNPQKLLSTARHLLNRRDITIIASDIRMFEFSGRFFDYVVHAASVSDPKVLTSKSLDVADTIIDGTRQLLNECVRNKIKHILYISSGAVYGSQAPDVYKLCENSLSGPDISSPKSMYGEAKRYAETLCAYYTATFGLSIVTARPFTFVGPYQDLDAGFAVTQFIRSGLNKEPLVINGDGTVMRSYCYGADLVIALWKVLLEGKSSRSYNIGSDIEISIIDLARKISFIMGGNLEILVKQNPDLTKKPSRYIPDINRIKFELGFTPQFGLDESLLRTINWFQGDK